MPVKFQPMLPESKRPLSMAQPMKATMAQITFFLVIFSPKSAALIIRTNIGARHSRTAARDRDTVITA